jgi:hypothetical protein
VDEDRKQLGRQIRREIHQIAPMCVAAVDHGDWVGAYFYQEDLAEGEKILKAKKFNVKVEARILPPIPSNQPNSQST